MPMGGSAPIVAVSLAPDAAGAVAIAKDGMVRTWANGKPVSTRTDRVPSIGAGASVVAAALSDNVVRVLWGDGRVLWLYERASDAPPGTGGLAAAPALVHAVALSPSGSAAVVACGDGTLRGLDVRTGEFGWTLAAGESPVQGVAMASDNGPVVAASADGTVRRYDLGSGSSAVVYYQHPVRAVAITPDGEVIVTASRRRPLAAGWAHGRIAWAPRALPDDHRGGRRPDR